MSAPAIALPRLVKRETEAQAPPQIQHEEIATLAYVLWQQRGCPEGTAELDWTEAEQLLQGGQTSGSPKSS